MVVGTMTVNLVYFFEMVDGDVRHRKAVFRRLTFDLADGYGSAFIATLLCFLVAAGSPVIATGTHSENKRANAIYNKIDAKLWRRRRALRGGIDFGYAYNGSVLMESNGDV